MDNEERRRQIEEEMARFEQEILQVQQTLQPPPPPPSVTVVTAASGPPFMATAAIAPLAGSSCLDLMSHPANIGVASVGLQPPPLPPMMMPPKPPLEPPSVVVTPSPPMMMLVPRSAPPPPQLMVPPRPPPLMMPSRLMRHIMPQIRPLPHSSHPRSPHHASVRVSLIPYGDPGRVSSENLANGISSSDQESALDEPAPPVVTVYSAPPKKAHNVETDEIMAALQKAEAEVKEAKQNKSVDLKVSGSGPPGSSQAVLSSCGTEVTTLTKQPTHITEDTSGKKGTASGKQQGITLDGTGNISSSSLQSQQQRKSKAKKVIRMAGQQVWEDTSLTDWDSDDFRIFCGDLGNDVTDDMLTRVFSKYPTFLRAKVVRDKRTNKSKGYGFVSFKEPQGFIKAMRELNGKYVGSRPIKLRKSTWRDRNIDVVKKKLKEKQKLGLL